MIKEELKEVVSVSGERGPDGYYTYFTTRRNGERSRLLVSARRYKFFHQWRCSTASGEAKIIHYFSTKQRAAPVPIWVPGKAERLEPIVIVYV